MNGVAVLNPPSLGDQEVPVFLQKDSPGASNFEIFDGTQIELAGSIRLVFRESITGNTGSTAASGPMRSINFAPALKPPMKIAAISSAVASASASFIDDEDFDDAFSKTGFRPAAAGQ